MILKCSAFTLNMHVVIGFKPITEMKGCIPSDLRCEMIVMPLDRVSRRDRVVSEHLVMILMRICLLYFWEYMSEALVKFQVRLIGLCYCFQF